jgi:hypothetical protein
MVSTSPIGEQSEKTPPNDKKWHTHVPLIAGTVVLTVVAMLASLQVKAMLTPEAQKTMEELYDVKKANSVALRDLNAKKAHQELILSQTKTEIAKVEEMNARVDVCITKLQSGEEHADDKCDPETFTTSTSPKTETGAALPSASTSSLGF